MKPGASRAITGSLPNFFARRKIVSAFSTEVFSPGETRQDLIHDLDWLQNYYDHPKENYILRYFQNVIWNPFYPEFQKEYEDALIGLIAAAWMKTENFSLPGYALLRSQPRPEWLQRGDIYTRIYYLAQFLKRNLITVGALELPNEDFPYSWNLDTLIERR